MSTEAVSVVPSGLEQLRAFAASAAGKRGMGATLRFRIVSVEEGQVVFQGDPDEDMYNPIGTVHGGYAATLLDSALGCAVHSKLQPTQGYTTLELKINYHRALTADSGPVVAEGKVVTFGRRVAFAEATLKDAAGRLCASATSTLLVFER
ncbi:uncharacterized protein (TIGR00369 family) [Povalibacter uvarum]|uniref:Uncharacterized protein (TIGR00369 family) n=1 Tax=Povalibacter uvarum TaxID=732238 RepID=A0A841HP56_9GAMM|nr:PaaI family thioesterase [Povalibacter uvarum]MBB6093918.1 uncharacterized protein (TIGR00369 family) [Povalibacter uvarum]